MHKKSKKELDGASLLGLKKEMAQPRMAKSARTTLANLTIADTKTTKYPRIRNRRQNHFASLSQPTGKGPDCCWENRNPKSRSAY